MYAKKNYENVHLTVSYDFFKVRWVQENQGVTNLMVPPKDKIAPLFDDFALHCASCTLMSFTTFVVSYLICSTTLGNINKCVAPKSKRQKSH
jgi:hypothetical protein